MKNLHDLIAKMDAIEAKGPVMEAVSLDAIMAAVGNDKDEQSRAAKLNDIAWKENLPGLYDPVSGYFIRKQSMPAGRGNQRYNIGATASQGDDTTLSGMGLIPDNARTTSPLGKLANKVTGKDSGAYDKDIRARSQAAAGNKPPSQAAQPGTVTAAGSEYGTKDAFAAKADDDLQNLDIGFGPGKMTPDDTNATTNQSDAETARLQRQNDSLVATKRQRYAELLAKAKNSTVPSGSRM